MSFSWLNKFHQTMGKAADYAEKKLAAYKLGMASNGSILGVRIETPNGCCSDAEALEKDVIFYPADAPRFPLTTCSLGDQCPCVYRPVMTYEVDPEEAAQLADQNKQRIRAEREARRQPRKKKMDGT
ncbi:MAG: hypothetical protein AAF633_12535 [Chloroflexota bacterium]